ncbi:MAG: GGDEF domain-containing protein [Candidatus Omnitrophota bacterium]|jgi:PAS domain S-box-containing protein/diguanylate cyclase (GGDEF)-like protein|nr:MAG: GGDEF domain-containing protein [Candidatus Omnitrophota bacterium]
MDFDNRFYSNILENLHEGVYYVDHNRKILYWNNAAERITGYSKKEVEGHRCSDNILVHVNGEGKNICHSDCPLSNSMREEKFESTTIYLHHKDGHRVPVAVRATPIHNSEGMILGAVEIFSENMEKVSDQEKIKELAKLAYLDELTGLPNKNYLNMKRKSIHAEIEETQQMYGIIMIRIKNYDSITEKHGLHITEKMLKVITKTLLNITPSSCSMGRWDETAFLCLFPNSTQDQTLILEKRYRGLVEKTSLDLGKNNFLQIITASKALLSKTGENEAETLQRFLLAPFR